MSSPGLSLRSRSTWRAVATSCLAIAALTFGASNAAAQNGRYSVPRTFSVVPITITSVAPDLATGQLIVSGLAGTTAFTTPLTVTPRQVAGAACPILDLSLGPINLTLLGLNVSTSKICLEVTAVPGGGLLGDLLCNLNGLLSGGAAPLSTAVQRLLFSIAQLIGALA